MLNIEKYSFLVKPEARELEKQIKVFYFSSIAFPFPVHFNDLRIFKYAFFASKSLRLPSVFLLKSSSCEVQHNCAHQLHNCAITNTASSATRSLLATLQLKRSKSSEGLESCYCLQDPWSALFCFVETEATEAFREPMTITLSILV